MRAIDTNILVRYLMQDDERQALAATALLAEPCLIAHTVLLETAWVLSSVFGVDRAALAATLADLVELPSVSVADPDLVDWAFARFAAGADFADMLHLIASRQADRFTSFDRRLATQAGDDSPVAIETLA